MNKKIFRIAAALVAFCAASVVFAAPIQVADYKETIRVACVGDSITYGAAIRDRQKNNYPVQLGRMLGDKWEVRNFGVNGATMLKKGDRPYWKQRAFQAVLGFKPHVVIIKLGTNDTKSANWQHKSRFAPDYKEMIDRFAALETKPRIWICSPVPAFPGNFGIRDSVIKNEVIPLCRQVAKEKAVPIIDLYKALSGKAKLFPDRIHPNKEGAALIAGEVYRTLTGGAGAAATYRPAVGKFPMSRWAAKVSPGNALREYPRPQLVRKDWMNLNGLWDYSVVARDAKQPESYQGRILVPFPIAAPLSGVGKMINSIPGRTYMNSRLWYRRSFKTPAKWNGKRILLHFGAVDWEATVLLNGKELGMHRGGYDAFSFDVTDTLKKDGANELVVAVWDPTFQGGYPRGKQIDKPHGICYTPCTGIWQTVWLEPVAVKSIDRLTIVPDIDRGIASLTAATGGSDSDLLVRAVVMDGKKKVAQASGKGGTAIELTITDPKLWWPDEPFLYDLKVELLPAKGGKAIDTVDSYFGMRKISLGKDTNGITRIMLNNKFIVHNGVLDQGFWPGGIYTAPTDEALRYDIEAIKKLGFNMSRKHLKIEPPRWYYWADKLGLLVWQDIPSAGDAPGHNDCKYATSNAHRYKQFHVEVKEMIRERFNHPCIVMWVLFNEGMGLAGKKRGYKLYDETKDFVRATFKLARELDTSRLIDHESGTPCGGYQGWNAMDLGLGDVMDAHCYGTTKCLTPTDKRASVIGEYRGSAKSYAPLVAKPGISGLAYTQITDVENERNGFLTYDRSKFKKDPVKWAAENKKHFGQATRR